MAVNSDPLSERRYSGTPRVANRLLKRVRDYAQVKGSGKLTMDVVENALKMEQIDTLGIDELDRSFLRALIKVYDGGPAGIEAIASDSKREIAAGFVASGAVTAILTGDDETLAAEGPALASALGKFGTGTAEN